MLKKIPGIEALVVNAIRQLQAAQGSTTKEITNFLAQQCNLTGPEFKRAVQLTIKRGLNYGILHRSKRGFVTCDRSNIPEPIDTIEIPDCMGCKRSACHGSRKGRSSRRRGGMHRGSMRRKRSSRRNGARGRSKARKGRSCKRGKGRKSMGRAMVRIRATRRVNKAADDQPRIKNPGGGISGEERPASKQTTQNNTGRSKATSKNPAIGPDSNQS